MDFLNKRYIIDNGNCTKETRFMEVKKVESLTALKGSLFSIITC